MVVHYYPQLQYHFDAPSNPSFAILVRKDM